MLSFESNSTDNEIRLFTLITFFYSEQGSGEQRYKHETKKKNVKERVTGKRHRKVKNEPKHGKHSKKARKSFIIKKFWRSNEE